MNLKHVATIHTKNTSKPFRIEAVKVRTFVPPQVPGTGRLDDGTWRVLTRRFCRDVLPIDDLIAEQSRVIARLVGPGLEDQFIDWLFQRILERWPVDDEAEVATAGDLEP